MLPTHDRSTTNISSLSEEVDRSTRMIVEKINPEIHMMERLIQQQDRIIRLLEEIVPKKEDDDHFPATAPSKGIYALPKEQLPEGIRIRRLKLYRAALNGDWEVAKGIYGVYEDDVGVGVSARKETVLHIAVAAKRIDFVKELVKKMNENDLAKTNNVGSTALFLAAATGVVELAKEMMKKNKEIAMIRDRNHILPIEMAASLGHKEMVEYLYQETRDSLSEVDLKKLFVTSIETDLYDVGLQLLTHYPDLATARAGAEDTEIGVTALHILAQKDPTFYNLGSKNQRGIFKICFNLGAQDVADKKSLQALQLVEQIWSRVILLSDLKISELISKPEKLIFHAAKRGNVEFLSILIREYPDLIWKIDNVENCYTIFHIAVKNRQEDVFKLIYEIGSSREILFMYKDKEDNNILHLAVMLAPKNRLNIVSGAALQMQRELLWFKTVQNVVQVRYAKARNKKGFTPAALFSVEHQGLKEKGEKWMKETSSSCMVVAALITTVAFAAAFTVPGGNNGDTGFPFFLEKVSFKIFAISNAISLVFSSATIINFLSILTPRYTEEDFLWLLPRKLRVGLLTLFVSIGAMMVVFSTTYFIFFNDRRLWIAILVAVIAAIPVIMFIWQHFQLIPVILSSTNVLDTPFHQGKGSLFRKEGEASDQRQNCKMLNEHLKIKCIGSINV